MKKLLFVLPVVLLLSAGCSSNSSVVGNQTKNTQQTQNQQTTPPTNTQTQQNTQTTTDETANWQVYNKNGVTFKYSTDWMVKTDSSTTKSGLNVFLQEKKYANDEVNPSGLSIADAAGTNLSGAKNTRVFDIKDKRNTNFLENVISIYFTEGTKTYFSNCTANVDTCNKIIATFKATK